MRYSLLVVVLGALGCSRAPASTPTPAPSDARVADARVADARPPDAPAAPAGQKGKLMSADETAINAYFEAKGWGKPVDVITYEHVPGLYHAEFADGGEYLAIQHGKIISARGLDAAAAFLKDGKVLSHQPSAKDLLTVLTLFEALPPIVKPAPDQFYDMPDHSELLPRLQLANGGGTLTLCYLLPEHAAGRANPSVKRIMKYTLKLGGKLAWKGEELQFDMSK